MIGKVLAGAAIVFGAGVALGRTEKGRELLASVDGKLQDLQDYIDARIEAEGGEPNADKIEQAVRDAAVRAAEKLGLNVDAMRVDVRTATPQPEAERDTPVGPDEV